MLPRGYIFMSAVRAYHWICLVGAIVFEVAGTTIMKAAQSWSIPYGAQIGIVTMLAFIGLSYYLLSLATTALPVGVAFAFWEGLGLFFITLSSVLLLGEDLTLTRFAALCAVAAGVLLVHHGTAHGDSGNSKGSGDDSGNNSGNGHESRSGHGSDCHEVAVNEGRC